MRTRDVFVVLNPVAGESGASVRPVVERHFERAGWGCRVYETTGDERVPDVVRAALRSHDRPDLVVAAGGDGTVSAVAGGLVHARVPLGVVPLGTGDAFARELGIPLDAGAALELLTGDHAVATIDALRVEDRLFLLNVSVGLSGIVMRDTRRDHKRRFGRLAYIWTGLRRLFGYQPHRFHVAIDGQRRTLRASEVVVANSGGVGDPSFRWSPRVQLDDGRVDVLIVRARTALDYLRLAFAVLFGRQSEEPAIRHDTARETVSVDAPAGLPVQADGEVIGHPPVEVAVVPGAVRVVVPRAGTDRLSISGTNVGRVSIPDGERMFSVTRRSGFHTRQRGDTKWLSRT